MRIWRGLCIYTAGIAFRLHHPSGLQLNGLWRRSRKLRRRSDVEPHRSAGRVATYGKRHGDAR